MFYNCKDNVCNEGQNPNPNPKQILNFKNKIHRSVAKFQNLNSKIKYKIQSRHKIPNLLSKKLS